MSTVLSILAALLLLGVLITVHEFGHYIAGRLLRFTVLEFSVGMGPVILHKEINGIRYCLRLLPIGGMCRFEGEEEGTAKTEGAFYAQKRWKRFLVIAAGPVMNILFAVLLSFVTLLAYGDYLPAIVEPPAASMPADVAGIRAGDVLLAIDGESVSTIDDAVAMILAADAEKTVLTVRRDDAALDITLYDIYDTEEGCNRIGVAIGYARVKCGFFEACGGSARYVWDILRETLSFIGTIFRGQAKSTDVTGVVGTVAIIGEAVRYGFETVLRLACLISASLAFTNLLPIPALDGGSMFFIIVSWIIGREIPPEKQGIINFIGLLLLLGLMAFVTFNDIRNLIGG